LLKPDPRLSALKGYRCRPWHTSQEAADPVCPRLRNSPSSPPNQRQCAEAALQKVDAMDSTAPPMPPVARGRLRTLNSAPTSGIPPEKRYWRRLEATDPAVSAGCRSGRCSGTRRTRVSRSVWTERRLWRVCADGRLSGANQLPGIPKPNRQAVRPASIISLRARRLSAGNCNKEFIQPVLYCAGHRSSPT